MSKRKPATLATFEERLKRHGAEILGPTNPYEVMRFRTKLGVGVIYTGKRGESWNAEAIAAREHLEAQKGTLAPVKVSGSRPGKSTVAALLIRDGDWCFFCGLALEGDMTIEHLVARSHGGPNHISNLFLAHEPCNREAGHLSAPEKIALAIKKRGLSTPSSEQEE